VSVVFAAGYLVPQQIAGKAYFRDAKQAFPDALFPPVPPLADIRTRAGQLASEINGAFPKGPIHVVAHSMAGLDARYLLSKNLLGLANPGRIISLSMLSTPNLGSPVADLLAGPQPSMLDPRRLTYGLLVQLASQFGLSTGALGDLTSGSAETFNPSNQNVAGVRYFSCAASGMESFILKPSRMYIETVGQTPDERANDGLVSVKSAAWTPLAEPAWPTDHIGEVGYNLSSPTLASAFDHIGAYHRILARAGA
jgi:triacylglycerol lipase